MNSSSPAIPLAARKTCSISERCILSENGLSFVRRKEATERTRLAQSLRFFGVACQQGHQCPDREVLNDPLPFQGGLPVALGVIGVGQPTVDVGQGDLDQLRVDTNFVRNDAIHFEAAVIHNFMPGPVAVSGNHCGVNIAKGGAAGNRHSFGMPWRITPIWTWPAQLA